MDFQLTDQAMFICYGPPERSQFRGNTVGSNTKTSTGLSADCNKLNHFFINKRVVFICGSYSCKSHKFQPGFLPDHGQNLNITQERIEKPSRRKWRTIANSLNLTRRENEFAIKSNHKCLNAPRASIFAACS